jgi:hypothetical protein
MMRVDGRGEEGRGRGETEGEQSNGIGAAGSDGFFCGQRNITRLQNA